MSLCVPFPDGVVLVDPDYLKDRKGTGPRAGGASGKSGWPSGVGRGKSVSGRLVAAGDEGWGRGVGVGS